MQLCLPQFILQFLLLVERKTPHTTRLHRQRC